VNLTKVGSTNSKNSRRQSTPPRSPSYPADRRELYEKTTRQDSPTPLVKRVIPTSKSGSPSRAISPSSPKSNESFVVLTQSQITKPPTATTTTTTTGQPTEQESKTTSNSEFERRKVSAKLFDAISGRSDIDYPMCAECADILLEMMSGKHVEVKKERDGYLEFIKGLQSEGQATADEQAAAEKELEEVFAFWT
jgi:beclin